MVDRPQEGLPWSCEKCPLMDGMAYGALETSKIMALRTSERVRKVAHHSIIHRAGSIPSEIYSVYSGWAYSFILLPGGQRQILSFYLPGDMIAVQAVSGRRVWFSVQSLTDVVLCAFDRAALQHALAADKKTRERLETVALASVANKDQRLVDLGRRRAMERIILLIQEIAARYRHLNQLGEDGFFPFPLRQEHIADALGLTRVHVSRILGQLRQKGMIELSEGRMRIIDSPAMQQISGDLMTARRTEEGLFVS